MIHASWPAVAFAGTLCATLLFRLVTGLYYRDGTHILYVLKLRRSDRPVKYYKRFDTVLAPLPFLTCWLEIAAAVLFARMNGHWGSYLLLAVIAGGRFRGLQEIGHNALHAALCRSKTFQWRISNVFFQFPTFKRDMKSRFVNHVQQHHPNADIEGKDPNLTRVVAAGMVPGIDRARFIVALLRPASPAGILESTATMLKAAAFQNADRRTVATRIVTVACVVSIYLLLGGWPALLFGYVVPLTVVYPLFAWWSLLSKHRWHMPVIAEGDHRQHDFDHGRATDFTGLFGPVIRYLICPYSDAYHLAHHLYPFVRHEYMPSVDRELKINEPRYTQAISDGLFFGRDGQPAALSDLYRRLVLEAREAAPSMTLSASRT